MGSYVVRRRRGYLLHAIHVGDGWGTHYAGLAHGGPVEEISLARFTSGHPDCMSKAPPTFDCREVIRLALRGPGRS